MHISPYPIKRREAIIPLPLKRILAYTLYHAFLEDRRVKPYETAEPAYPMAAEPATDYGNLPTKSLSTPDDSADSD